MGLSDTPKMKKLRVIFEPYAVDLAHKVFKDNAPAQAAEAYEEYLKLSREQHRKATANFFA